MKKGILIIIGLSLIFIATACSENTQNEEEVQDIREMVYDYSSGELDDTSASINSHELIVTNNKNEKVSYNLEEEEFFVSIAPFVNQTHPCAVHSLTGCQGELTEEQFNVKIQDEEGNVFVNETMTSFKNGFIDLWLPREKTYQVRMEQDGKIAESEISTFEGDNTCITSMKLI